jgi:hypothetical protein
MAQARDFSQNFYGRTIVKQIVGRLDRPTARGAELPARGPNRFATPLKQTPDLLRGPTIVLRTAFPEAAPGARQKARGGPLRVAFNAAAKA